MRFKEHLQTDSKSHILKHLNNTNRNCKELSNTDFFFFNRDSLHARLNSHYKAWSYKKKSAKKIKAYKKSVLKESTYKKCLLILAIKPFRSLIKGGIQLLR